MSELIVVAQKCKCGSVWCDRCFVAKHADSHMDELRKFDWKRTREVTFTVDPEYFNNNGQAAYQYMGKHRMIAGFIRNLTRGKKIYDHKKKEWKVLYPPLNVTKWMWFLEWHKNGMPHYHCFIETDTKGKAGQIGETRIHEYWSVGRIIHEKYIKDAKHWFHITGYFKKTGYFTKGKKHQVQLPPWAMDVQGLKIRRVGSYVKNKSEQPARKKKEEILPENITRQGNDYIDTETGEVTAQIKRKTYRMRFESCGNQTRIKISNSDTYIFGLFDIPYKDIRTIQGEFVAGKGYSFSCPEIDVLQLLDKLNRVYECSFRKQEMTAVQQKLEKWRRYHIKQGVHHYYRVYA